MFDVPDTAVASINGQKVAEAKAIRIIQKDPGPNQLEVHETYLTPEGKVVYESTIIIRFGLGQIAEEHAIRGTKTYRVFKVGPRDIEFCVQLWGC
jgi:hypothetical protein